MQQRYDGIPCRCACIDGNLMCYDTCCVDINNENDYDKDPKFLFLGLGTIDSIKNVKQNDPTIYKFYRKIR